MGIFLEDESETTNTPRTIQSGESSFQVRDYIPMAIASIIAFSFFTYIFLQIDDYEAEQKTRVQMSPSITPPSASVSGDCVHTTQFSYTTQEEFRMREIINAIMTIDDSLQLTNLKREFQSILHSHGKLCDSDIKMTLDVMTEASRCHKYFYADALTSYRTMSPHMSEERRVCESNLYPKGTQQSITNEVYISYIAMREPISTPQGLVTFSENEITSTLNDIDNKLRKIEYLFQN